MPYVQLIPANTKSGGRRNPEPRAWLTNAGLLMMSDAVADTLGDPEMVIVEVDTEKRKFRLTPSTPDDRGAFTLSGAGTSRRIYLKAFVSDNPGMVGDYQVSKQARSVVLSLAANE